jgi:glutathione peroxidase
MTNSIYDFSFKSNSGEEVSISSYAGKVFLIVNTATFCGLTPQYAGLQQIYDMYKNIDFDIIAFPCNQFREQEPGTDLEIKEFCETNYGVTFTIASKIDVNGENAHPLYKHLTDSKGADIEWNFEKFLVSKSGRIKNFGPKTTPMELQLDIEMML